MDVLFEEYYNNSVKEWLIALAIIIASIVLARAIYWAFKPFTKKFTSKTASDLDDVLVDKIEEPFAAAIALAGIWYALGTLQLGELNGGQVFVDKAMIFILSLDAAWMASRVVTVFFEHMLAPLVSKSETDLDDVVMPIVLKGARFTIWSLAIIVGLQNAGYDIGAVLAGLGIGGLALAMAAKDTVMNVFGGITVFIDKPFKINDRIKIAGFDGTVIEIGLRSSRLKTLEGRIVTIPNAKFTDGCVENITLEPTRKVILNLGLTYDTPPENMQLAIDTLNNLLKDNTSLDGNHLVGFNAFGDFSLGLIVVYYINKGEDILGAQTNVNMEILKKFNELNLEFAFPTQTILAEVNSQKPF